MHRRHLPIAEPCSNDWKAMKGSCAVRFCGACSKNVYNLSMLTEREAKEALAVRPKDVCVRYHVDAKGDVIFFPEPVVARRHALRQKAIAAFAISTMAACTEPPSDEKAAVPIAVAAPPVATDPESAKPAIAIASAPVPAKTTAHKHDASCTPSWDDRFKKVELTAAERAAWAAQDEADPLQGDLRLAEPEGLALPHQPSRDDVMQALHPIRDLVWSKCEGGKTVLAELTINGKTGKVTGVEVPDVDRSTAACVSKQVRRARFPIFSAKTFSVKYPFRLPQP
jgi:hypothetical protein